MTDEEMAEEYLDEKCKDCYMCSYSEHKNPYKICQRRKDRKQAFLAGLKAGRPQWHDLRKDPNDLPKDDKDMLMSGHLILLIRMKGTDYLSISIGQFNFSTQEFSYQHIIGLTEVYAWKEIVLPDLPKESE